MIKEPEMKPPFPIINPYPGLEVKKNVHYVPGLSEELRSTFHHNSGQVIFKGGKIPLNLSLCIPKIKFHHN